MDTPSIPLKRCTKCGIEYPATTEFFRKRSSNKTGISTPCKDCGKVIRRQYYAEHREEELSINRVWRENNREVSRAASRRWNKNNPDRVRENNKRWRSANPERRRLTQRRWYINNPHAARMHIARRRTRKLANEGTHTAADIEAQFKRQKGKCYYCGRKMTKVPRRRNSATVDHVIPLERGGRNSPDNLVIACLDCNLRKHNKLPHEWAEGGRLL